MTRSDARGSVLDSPSPALPDPEYGSICTSRSLCLLGAISYAD
jgi:hypothetical protein